MRIVHITPAGGYGRVQIGGAERAVIEMAEESARRDHDVTVIAPDEFLAQAGMSSAVSTIGTTLSMRTLPSLASALKSLRPDVVVSHLLRGALIGGYAGSVATRDAALVTVLHNSLEQMFQSDNTPGTRRSLYRRALRLIHRNARSSTVAISESNYTDLVVYDGFASTSIRLIPDWVSPSFRPRSDAFRDELRFALGIENSHTKMILFAGRLEDQKNPLLAVKAVSNLQADYRLVIAGGGSLAADIEAAANHLNVRLSMLGQTANIEDYMAAADVVLMTSRYEGFGRVAVEALATGTPVVSTPAAGLQDTLSPFASPDVQFVDSVDLDGWRDAIMIALGSADVRDRSRLHDAVMDEYGLEKALDAYFALYQDLLR